MVQNDDDIFDFGFSAVDETELDSVQQASTSAKSAAQSADDLKHKLDALYSAILPLLDNLKKNPEKDYIHWPNRVDKVEQFEKHISKIVND